VYRVPVVDYHMQGVLTNTMATGAYRGAGRPEGNFIMERLIEKAGRELGMDPVAIRMKNLLQPGDFPHPTHAGEIYDAGNATLVGSDNGICIRTAVGAAWECIWTVTLSEGQITVEGPFYDSGDSVLAVTGGTGEFAGALGEMALSARGTDGSAYNFTYRIK
jgi:hypothetical protein